MTHYLGPVVADGRTVTNSAFIDLVPPGGPLGGPRFLILHFDLAALSPGAELRLDLGYDTDVFTSDSGSDFWSRPVNPLEPDFVTPRTIRIEIVGGTGSARLVEYGAGQPSVTPGQVPGTSSGSQSNPDVFLHTSPYVEPIYETRARCGTTFDWSNSRCSLAPLIPDVARDRAIAASGIIVEVHDGHVSSCSGTLIAADLFMTSRHCLTDPDRHDLRSASVTFDYAPNCDGSRPAGHSTRFFKVLEDVAFGAPPTGSIPGLNQDWVVLRLDAAPGDLPAPAIMRSTGPAAGERIFAVHHPVGAAKKIQTDLHSGGSSTTLDICGGSSGSSLFDTTGRVITGPASTAFNCGVSHTPLSSVRSGLGSPPVPPSPLDVMIVFDRSGSMAGTAPPSGRTKLAEAKDAAALFTQLVRDGAGDRIGLSTFSSSATTPVPPALAASAKLTLTGGPPFTGGTIASIAAGGATSIGAGLSAALTAIGTGSANQPTILLLTDGLQNTAPTIESVEPSLGSAKVNVIGFGSDANLDGPLLDRVARDHNGHFTRATDGLALRKFFGLSFGNIFESGALLDPDFVLAAGKDVSEPHPLDVFDETQITVIIGWEGTRGGLSADIVLPSGALLDQAQHPAARGNNWAYWRIPLPHGGEREGRWQVSIKRERPQGNDGKGIRYFLLVNAAGGPKLEALRKQRRYYTGDPVDALVGLHYPDRTVPHDAEVELEILAPRIALGTIVAKTGLAALTGAEDEPDQFHATLQKAAAAAGGVLQVDPHWVRLPLFDDGMHDDGAMEPDGIFNAQLTGVIKAEGTYHFRAVARYGRDLAGTREAQWSIHVEPGIDPGQTEVNLEDIRPSSGGNQGTLVFTPKDVFGNLLGPGRGGTFLVEPLPGTTLLGEPADRGNGDYAVTVSWPPEEPKPEVSLGQPDRPPITISPDSGDPQPRGCWFWRLLMRLLQWLGLR